MAQTFLQQWIGPRYRGPVDDDISDPESDDQQIAAVPVEPTYYAPESRRILDQLEKGDLVGAVFATSEAEAKTAPSYQQSRIPADMHWLQDAVVLFAQPHPEVLESFIDLTLPQRALHGHLERFVRRPPGPGGSTWNGSPDPVVYVNFIADKTGKGLSPDDMEMFLDAVEVGAHLKTDPNGVYSRSGHTVDQGVNIAFNRLRTGAYAEFHHVVKSTSDSSLVTIVKAMCLHYRNVILPAARAENLNHIMFKPEVGWSVKGYERCEDHRTLDAKSPHAFRLVQCVLRRLFPDRGFRLHQYILFEILREDQAHVGESIGSQLCGSYPSYGGFNIEQAGKSVEGGLIMTAKEWRYARAAAWRKNYLKYMPANMQKTRNLYNERLKQIQDQNRLYQLHEQRESLQDEVKQSIDMAELETSALDIITTAVERELDYVREELEDLDREDRVDQQNLGALNTLAEAFELMEEE